MTNTVSLYTLGCRLNQAETATLTQTFLKEGFRIVHNGQPAEIAVINTCTVTKNGDADTRRLVNKIYRQNNQSQIALIGCQAQLQRDKLLSLPGVCWVVGNGAKMDLARLIIERKNTHPQVIVPTIQRQPFTHTVAGIDRWHTRANIKIQDGCNFFCSFCEIPYARGRARSRKFENILAEAQQLANAGHIELVITGINVGEYADQGKSILDVVEQLETVKNLCRIRISSIEPTTISTDFIDKMAASDKMCRYLHLPVQSGDNKILRSMKRKYEVTDFLEFIQYAKKTIPELCLGTDVIVGFPGETDEDFERTFTFLKENPFSYFHVFSYSERNFARSQSLPDKIPQYKIRQRSHTLRELSLRKRRMYYESFVGHTIPVLFEQKKNGYWTGLTDTYIRVNVKTPKPIKNQILPVKLEKIENHFITGSLS